MTQLAASGAPTATLELQAIQAALPEIAARGANIVPISPQAPPNSHKSIRQNALTFPIFSDPMGKVAEAFGLRFALPGYLIELYNSLKNHLPAFNSDLSWTLPMRARYVIGTDGVIAYAEVNPDYPSSRTRASLYPSSTSCRLAVRTERMAAPPAWHSSGGGVQIVAPTQKGDVR